MPVVCASTPGTKETGTEKGGGEGDTGGPRSSLPGRHEQERLAGLGQKADVQRAMCVLSGPALAPPGPRGNTALLCPPSCLSPPPHRATRGKRKGRPLRGPTPTPSWERRAVGSPSGKILAMCGHHSSLWRPVAANTLHVCQSKLRPSTAVTTDGYTKPGREFNTHLLAPAPAPAAKVLQSLGEPAVAPENKGY